MFMTISYASFIVISFNVDLSSSFKSDFQDTLSGFSQVSVNSFLIFATLLKKNLIHFIHNLMGTGDNFVFEIMLGWDATVLLRLS